MPALRSKDKFRFRSRPNSPGFTPRASRGPTRDQTGKKGGTQDFSKESAPASSQQSGRREEATIKRKDLGPRRSEKPSAPASKRRGEGCKTDPEPDMDNGQARVRNMRSKCRCSYVLQFTFRRAVCCVLHRPPSQVIHCVVLSLFDSLRLPGRQSPDSLFFLRKSAPPPRAGNGCKFFPSRGGRATVCEKPDPRRKEL